MKKYLLAMALFSMVTGGGMCGGLDEEIYRLRSSSVSDLEKEEAGLLEQLYGHMYGKEQYKNETYSPLFYRLQAAYNNIVNEVIARSLRDQGSTSTPTPTPTPTPTSTSTSGEEVSSYKYQPPALDYGTGQWKGASGMRGETPYPDPSWQQKPTQQQQQQTQPQPYAQSGLVPHPTINGYFVNPKFAVLDVQKPQPTQQPNDLSQNSNQPGRDETKKSKGMQEQYQPGWGEREPLAFPPSGDDTDDTDYFNSNRQPVSRQPRQIQRFNSFDIDRFLDRQGAASSRSDYNTSFDDWDFINFGEDFEDSQLPDFFKGQGKGGQDDVEKKRSAKISADSANKLVNLANKFTEELRNNYATSHAPVKEGDDPWVRVLDKSIQDLKKGASKEQVQRVLDTLGFFAGSSLQNAAVILNGLADINDTKIQKARKDVAKKALLSKVGDFTPDKLLDTARQLSEIMLRKKGTLAFEDMETPYVQSLLKPNDLKVLGKDNLEKTGAFIEKMVGNFKKDKRLTTRFSKKMASLEQNKSVTNQDLEKEANEIFRDYGVIAKLLVTDIKNVKGIIVAMKKANDFRSGASLTQFKRRDLFQDAEKLITWAEANANRTKQSQKRSNSQQPKPSKTQGEPQTKKGVSRTKSVSTPK